MPKVSDAQIASSAAKAGFSGKNLTIAVAVAIGESGGNTEAQNSFGAGHYGLWQISALHQILKTGDWKDPDFNAKCAYAVWKSQGWNAWQVYTNKKYLLYMPQAEKVTSSDALKNIPLVPDPTDIAEWLAPQIASGMDGMTALNSLVALVSSADGWKRIGMFAIGGLLIMIGLYKLTDAIPVVNSARDVAVKVITKGMVSRK